MAKALRCDKCYAFELGATPAVEVTLTFEAGAQRIQKTELCTPCMWELRAFLEPPSQHAPMRESSSGD